jgi:hypothetical protein
MQPWSGEEFHVQDDMLCAQAVDSRFAAFRLQTNLRNQLNLLHAQADS